jgi:hypothetical protein
MVISPFFCQFLLAMIEEDCYVVDFYVWTCKPPSFIEIFSIKYSVHYVLIMQEQICCFHKKQLLFLCITLADFKAARASVGW